MKITELRIAPERIYSAINKDNRLRATVKLADERSTVETVIPEQMIAPLLDLVSSIVAEAATKNVADFAASVAAIEGDRVEAITD